MHSIEIRELAGQLFARSWSTTPSRTAADAAEQAMIQLGHALIPLVGAGGYRMLVARALTRTRERHDVLTIVRCGPERYLEGLPQPAEDVADEVVLAAGQDLVAELIGLIARFLGADMAVRLVRQTMSTAEGKTDA